MILKKFKKKKNKGFTLIEMVIVITIIGLLTSVAVTKYGKVQENAKKNADYATAANLATAATIALSDGKTKITPADLETKGYIQFVPKPKSVPNSEFTIISSTGNDSVTVKIGDTIFYPKEKANTDTTNTDTPNSDK